jgi:hypothetical protein
MNKKIMKVGSFYKDNGECGNDADTVYFCYFHDKEYNEYHCCAVGYEGQWALKKMAIILEHMFFILKSTSLRWGKSDV